MGHTYIMALRHDIPIVQPYSRDRVQKCITHGQEDNLTACQLSIIEVSSGFTIEPGLSFLSPMFCMRLWST
jgi:hypothetical protein